MAQGTDLQKTWGQGLVDALCPEASGRLPAPSMVLISRCPGVGSEAPWSLSCLIISGNRPMSSTPLKAP